MDKPLYDFVMDSFAESDQTYRQIAKGAGMSKRTVEKVARREIENPGVNTVQQLANYFRKQKRKVAA